MQLIGGVDMMNASHIILNGIAADSGGDLVLGVGMGGHLIITSASTSDPHVLNAVWNDSGTLKISAG